MSTRSLIGRLLPNGNVEYVYCHSDGYPSHNGRILNTYYSDPAKVAELMALGDLSSLGANIGVTTDFNTRDFDTPEAKRQCYAYGRDRGENDIKAGNVVNETAFGRALKAGPAYHYLFKDGQWYGKHASAKNFVPISDMLAAPDVD